MRWGALRNHAEFSRIIDKKLRRVGANCGELLYHPSW